MSGYQPHTNVSTPVQHEGQVVHDFGDHQQAPLAQGYESTQATPVYHEKTRYSPSGSSQPSSDETRTGTAPQMEYGKSEHAAAAETGEYATLIQYIQDSAARKRSGGDEEEGGLKTEYKRVWYMPWKKNKIQVDKDGNVVSSGAVKTPESWLDTDMRRGLTEEEAKKRRAVSGWNELEAKRENLIIKFFGFFTGPILYVMEIAVVLAAGLEDWIDFGVIIGMLMLNAFVGWYQEKAAGDIVEQLKSGIALRATIVRNGQEHETEARDIVPGDIVIVEDGNTIPADGRVLADYDDKDGSAARAILQGIEDARRRKAMAEKDEEEDEGGVDRGPPVVSADQSGIW